MGKPLDELRDVSIIDKATLKMGKWGQGDLKMPGDVHYVVAAVAAGFELLRDTMIAIHEEENQRARASV